jgi:hypothetical protein
MTLVYIDGFDEYVTADIPDWGWTGSQCTIAAGGRVAGTCMQLGGNGSTNLNRAVSAGARFTVGFAWKTGTHGTTNNLCRFFEGATEHGRLFYNGNGTFTISRAGSIPATSANMGITSGVWYYIEVDYNCHDTTGAWEVRFNGVAIIGPTSGLDTRNGGTAGLVDSINLSELSGGAQHIDDLYIASGSDFQGDCRVITRLPNGEGALTDWTPSTGTDNSALVDDAAPNDDTDYVSSSTANQRDTYLYADLGVTGAVRAVQVGMMARKDDAGTREIAPVVRQGGVNYDGAAQNLSTAYAGLYQLYAQDPSTAAAWSVAGVNSAEFGVKEVT